MMARKKSRKRNQGRRYEAGEWVQFVLHGLAGRDVEVTPELKEAAVNFEAAVEEAVATCIRKYPPKGGVQATIDELRDEGANTIYDVYATLAGEGVGIWDGRWDAYYPNADRQHWQKLANCLRKELSRQYGALESAFVDAAFAEQDNPSRTKNPSWKFSDDPEDVQWIRETFIPSLPDNVQSYILFGNEDYPEKISVFAEKSPTIYSTGTIYRPDKSGRYKKAGTERNPLKDMPGGSVSGCIAAQKRKKKGKRPRDPGAYCAAIADRIEPGWRTKNPQHDEGVVWYWDGDYVGDRAVGVWRPAGAFGEYLAGHVHTLADVERDLKRRGYVTKQGRSGRLPSKAPTKSVWSAARKKGNPYQGDAVELAKYRKSREEWERKGKKGPPPLQPEARGTRRAARNTKAGRAAHRLSNP